MAKFITKWEQVINASVFGICLVIAFILPLFSSGYSYASMLRVWAYRSLIIASICGLSFYTFASEINLLSVLIRSRKCKLGFANYEAIAKTAAAKKIFIDFEGALLDEDSNIKEDSYGVVKELKAYKLKDISLACNISEDEVDEVCKDLTMLFKSYQRRKVN